MKRSRRVKQSLWRGSSWCSTEPWLNWRYCRRRQSRRRHRRKPSNRGCSNSNSKPGAPRRHLGHAAGSNIFKQWPQLAEDLAHTVKAQWAVLDGEIVVLRSDRSSDFNALLFRREWPHYYAFDLLQLEGEDLRGQALLGRKRTLRRLISRRDPHSRLRFLDHVRGRGRDLYSFACPRDTEGGVAKWAMGAYYTRRRHGSR